MENSQRRRLAFLAAYLIEATKLPTDRLSQLNADLDALGNSDNSDDIHRLARAVTEVTRPL